MGWQRVAVVVAGERAPMLADALEEEGALSVDVADADAGTDREGAVFAEPGADPALWPRCRVSALFALETDASAALERGLDASGSRALEAASIDRLEDADWVRETQRQFEPMRVGDRLWIVPTWHEAPDRDGLNIELDPGAAFGTGSHATTRLCLRWLERNVGPADTVLDYGCGSGILAIAALKLGASAASAVDIDPLALEAARYNARRNRVALDVVPASNALHMRASLTIANILANPLRVLAPLIAAHTASGGRIALSGILEPQAHEVSRAYEPWCELRVEAREQGWVLLTGTRSEASAC